MAESSDNARPPRRAQARPFTAPGAVNDGSVLPVGGSVRRRIAALFTPPSRRQGDHPAQSAEPATPEKDGEAHARDDANDRAQHTPGADESIASPDEAIASPDDSARAYDWASEDNDLIIEAEAATVMLGAAGTSGMAVDPPSDAIEFIAQDEVNRLLAGDPSATGRPRLEGLELETTELSFDSATIAAAMAPTEFWGSISPDELYDLLPPVAASTVMESATPAPDAPFRDAMAEVDSLFASTGPLPGDTVAASTTPTPADAPTSSISDTGDASPASDNGDGATERKVVVEETAAAAVAVSLEEIKATEPWAAPLAPSSIGAPENADVRESRFDPYLAVADALERVAARIRAGEVALPDDWDAETEEAALSLALAALLRASR